MSDVGSDVSEMELTEEQIETAMVKADAKVCFGNDRCYAFPHRVEDAMPTCTSKGRCKVGWVVQASGRESWDGWLGLRTGLVKLIPWANA